MKRFNLLFLISSFFIGCSYAPVPASSFTVLNWNAQTFFDGNRDGIEYSEFKKSAQWNQEAYLSRLLRLCNLIQLADCDLVVLEELENCKILHDISNQLAGNSWKSSKIYNYGCFSKNPGDAIGIGILSRFPVSEIKNHNLDIRTETETQPSMRPVIEATLDINGKRVKIFANHWKSKSGGQEESECWRDWQERLLGNLFDNSMEEFAFACGDFNRDIEEFLPVSENNGLEGGNIQFRKIRWEEDSGGLVKVFSPWKKVNGELVFPGSYWYNNRWERIDHFFGNSKISITEFKALTEGEWCSEEYIPIGYKLFNGTGYSDHLPIACRIKLLD